MIGPYKNKRFFFYFACKLDPDEMDATDPAGFFKIQTRFNMLIGIRQQQIVTMQYYYGA